MRSEGYCSWVCLSVCVSVKSHLTSGASVRPENAVTYSAGNEGQNICGVFSETAPLQRSSTPSVDGHTYSRPFFLRKAARMRIIVFTTCGGVDRSGHFFPVPVQSCEFRELPLVMPPSKVCPQCNAVVPIRLKVCRNRLEFALYNADRVNFKSRNYHVVAYNISILAEGLHFSALVIHAVMSSLICFVLVMCVFIHLLWLSFLVFVHLKCFFQE